MRRTDWLKFSLGMLVAVTFAGCGDDGGDGGGDDAGLGDDSGGGGSDTGGSNGCEPPAGGEVVMPWTVVPSVDGTDGPAYGLATDGTSLYVNFFEVVLKMPLAGGDVTEVYRSTAEIPLGLRMWQDDDSIVVQESASWVRIPFGGGAPTPVSVAVPGGGRVFGWDPATDTFLVSWEDFETDLAYVDQVTIDGATTPLVVGVPEGRGRRWFEGGGHLYTQGADTFEGTPDDAVYRFSPPSYSATALALTPAADQIVGADAASLYYGASQDPATWGLYRVSHAGGASERASDDYWLGSMHGWNGVGSDYVNDASYLWRVPPSGDAIRITSVPTQGCTTHEVLGHDGWVYTVTYRSESGENQVWRIRQ